jgi:ComF family protein
MLFRLANPPGHVEARCMFRSSQPIVNRWRRWRLTGGRQLSRFMAATLFPPRCCLCGFEGANLDLDLCRHCFADLPWAQSTAASFAAFRFEAPIDQLVRSLKYQGALPNARVLGVLLAEAVRERGGDLPRVLVPVPLHPARLRERGFNQALSIARYAGRMLEIPFMNRAVHRARNTPSQTGLDGHARRRNVRGAFIIEPGRLAVLKAARHVAVVDDVTTTGSTLAELRQVLREAGVQRVDVWAVARANPHAGDGPPADPV